MPKGTTLVTSMEDAKNHVLGLGLRRDPEIDLLMEIDRLPDDGGFVRLPDELLEVRVSSAEAKRALEDLKHAVEALATVWEQDPELEIEDYPQSWGDFQNVALEVYGMRVAA